MPSEWLEVAPGAGACDASSANDDDVELWAIRCPKGFDVNALQGVKVGLQPDGAPVALTKGYALGPVPAHESANLLGVLPTASNKGWTTAKPFARQFSVSLQPTAPDWPIGMEEPGPLGPVPQKEGLRLRHAFWGGKLPAGTPIAGPRTRPRGASAGSAAAAEPSTPGAGSSSGKKKAKKDAAAAGGGAAAAVPPGIAAAPAPAAAGAASADAAREAKEKKERKKEKKAKKREAAASAQALPQAAAAPAAEEAKQKKKNKKGKKEKRKEQAGDAQASGDAAAEQARKEKKKRKKEQRAAEAAAASGSAHKKQKA